MILRELHQLVIAFTEQYASIETGGEWQNDAKRTIIQLIHKTVTTLRDGRHAAALARNVGYHHGIGADGSKTLRSSALCILLCYIANVWVSRCGVC